MDQHGDLGPTSALRIQSTIIPITYRCVPLHRSYSTIGLSPRATLVGRAQTLLLGAYSRMHGFARRSGCLFVVLVRTLPNSDPSDTKNSGENRLLPVYHMTYA